MGLGDGLLHVIEAPFEILKGIFDTIIGLISTMLSAFGSLVASLGDAFSGVLGFVAGNLTVIAVIAAAFFGYVIYQNRQGKQVVSSSMKSK